MTSNTSDTSTIWVKVDIEALTDWPDYEDPERYDHIPWQPVCDLALSIVQFGEPSQQIYPSDDLPEPVQRGLELLLSIDPVHVTPRALTDGGHRLAAMKRQGVRYTVGVLYPHELQPCDTLDT